MNAFDESWYRQHQSHMASLRGEPVKLPPLLIEFSIPHAMRLPNVVNGTHWASHVAYRKELLPLVADAVKPWTGHQPIDRAKVTIIRYSVRLCDHDNCVASVKPLVDLLLVRSGVHPHSLGLLVDDGPDHIDLSVSSAKAETRAEVRTAVRIERLDPVRAATSSTVDSDDAEAADFTAVLDWAEPRGILFKEWNDIPRVNAIRERLNLLPFKRQFPTKGRFG